MSTSFLSVAVLYFCLHTTASEPCETGWVNFQNSCYKFPNVNATWGDALAICMSMNAHLLEIETVEENNFIKGKHMNAHNYWTGGNDIEQESIWRWITSRNPITFFDWADGQPSNLRHRQDCLIIHHSNHKWHDFDCRAENFFICEKQSTNSDTTQGMTTESMTTTRERTTEPVVTEGTAGSFITNIGQNTNVTKEATATSSSEMIIG